MNQRFYEVVLFINVGIYRPIACRFERLIKCFILFSFVVMWNPCRLLFHCKKINCERWRNTKITAYYIVVVILYSSFSLCRYKIATHLSNISYQLSVHSSSSALWKQTCAFTKYKIHQGQLKTHTNSSLNTRRATLKIITVLRGLSDTIRKLWRIISTKFAFHLFM